MLNTKMQGRLEGIAAARGLMGRGSNTGPLHAAAAIKMDIDRDNRLARHLQGTVSDDFRDGFLSECERLAPSISMVRMDHRMAKAAGD
jgi:hypothetical protein